MKPPILIVEDNELNMRLFSDLLSALEILEKEVPGVIVMDIQLPGMSGVECTKTIKADPRLSAIPVIAVTAFAMAGDEARFRKAGCDDYMSKPISVPIFAETIAKHYRNDIGATS